MKTRFAPSPTGYIHIGNVRSAIYPYLLARQQKGKFILRIEDTDQARYVEGATDLIEETLHWLGMDWDEGPVVGGPNGPYFQTERKAIYLEWAQKLLAMGRAYADDTPSEKVNEYREACHASGRAFLYRDYRPENPPKWREGLPIRFKASPKMRTWHDAVMGEMHGGPETQDDIILIKADGLPTYNFAHIVDDYLMEVSYVIRGVEYLPSVPNYLAIYEALEIPVPTLVSLPHILAPSGNKKLGKRDGAKSVTEYRTDGVLPQAMLNYLASLGWNDGTEQEVYTREELIQKFALERVQTSGARYDEVKLMWLNGQWIRRIATGQRVTPGAETDLNAVATPAGIDELYALTEGFWPEVALARDADYRKKVLAIIYDRLKVLSDLQTMTTYFFADPEINLTMLVENKFLKKMSEEELATLLQTVVTKLEKTVWTAADLQTAMNELLTETGKKPAELFSAVRIALSYAPFSPALPLTMEVLGKDTVLARLNATITALEND